MQNGKSLMLHCYNVTMLQYYKNNPYLMPIDNSFCNMNCCYSEIMC